MWVIKDVPEAIYGLAISSRLIANHAFDRSQRDREKRVATALQRRSYRLGTNEFAESHHRCSISEVMRRGQVLPEQVLRHLMASIITRSELMEKTHTTLPFRSRIIAQSSTESTSIFIHSPIWHP